MGQTSPRDGSISEHSPATTEPVVDAPAVWIVSAARKQAEEPGPTVKGFLPRSQDSQPAASAVSTIDLQNMSALFRRVPLRVSKNNT